jgi:outer membrane protein assembly factor BamD (BamD/ComL family)
MKASIIFVFILIALFQPLHGVKNVKSKKQAQGESLNILAPQEHFRLGTQALQDQQWAAAASHFSTVADHYPKSPYCQEALFHLGIAYYNLGELDQANEALTRYLQESVAPNNFEEAISYKFEIAEHFRAGAKRRIFGYRSMPKWLSGTESALDIYDEVIAALPNHELGGNALFCKGLLQWQMKMYKEGIESFQKFIKRFPKDEKGSQAYLNIAKIYLQESQVEQQNSDLLAFAEINLRHFEEDFPRDERLEAAKLELLAVKEVYAKGLWETGQFYERLGKPKASILYYRKAVNEFPETKIAELCRGRLRKFYPNASV